MKKLAIALAFSVAAFGAQANVVHSLSDIDSSAGVAKFFYEGTNLKSSFTDTLEFTLDAPLKWSASGSAEGDFFGFKLGKLIWGQGLKTLRVDIFGNTYSGSLSKGVFLFDSIDVAIPKQIVGAGTYHAVVSGTTVDSKLIPGKPTYSFSLQAIAQPVPEPESYAMLLAGLGVMGALARRRRVA